MKLRRAEGEHWGLGASFESKSDGLIVDCVSKDLKTPIARHNQRQEPDGPGLVMGGCVIVETRW